MISIYLYAVTACTCSSNSMFCVHYCGSAMTIADLRLAIGKVIAATPCLQPFVFQFRSL